MNGMLEKGQEENDDEQVQFAAYKQFCDETTLEKKRAIEEANEPFEVLEADMEVIEKMLEKGKEENEEQAQFAVHKQFCDDTIVAVVGVQAGENNPLAAVICTTQIKFDEEAEVKAYKQVCDDTLV